MSDNNDLVNRGDDPYPNGIKAEAIALVYESGNFSEAARTMAERYPERHPSRQLITRWFSQVDAEAFAALGTERKAAFQVGIMEVASKAIEKMFDALDDMQPGQLPIAAGIAMDKGLRLMETEHPTPAGNDQKVIIIINAERPEVIEGELVGEAKDGS